MMIRVLSGIKPSGEITLGNYLGAMKRWAEEQKGRENFYFIPNLHALTERQTPVELKRQTISAIAWLLVMGVDPRQSTIFVQSQIPAHTELAWILNNYTTMGELNRMVQFKDKAQKNNSAGELVGLFDYPVLMAADILLYDADEVPVGEDQVQHIELTRDIANRFNNLYGPIFKIPKATVQKVGAKIMNLQDPTKKMSKSDQDLNGVIFMTDSNATIKKKILKAITDSGHVVASGKDKLALTNLLHIYSLVSGDSLSKIERRYQNQNYANFKQDLANLVAEKLTQLQIEYNKLMADKSQIIKIIQQGNQIANTIANKKIAQTKKALGLL